MTLPFGIPTLPSAKPGAVIGGVQVFDDFVGTGFWPTASLAAWDATSSGSSNAMGNVADGGVDLTVGSDTGDDATITLNMAPFQFRANNDLYFECRFLVTATTAYPFVGVGPMTMDAALGANTAAHVGFTTQGDASLDFTTADGSTQSVTDTGTDLVADTYVRVAFRWVGIKREFLFYVDGSYVGKHTAVSDNVPALDTGYSVVLSNDGNLAATTTRVDYVYTSAQRIT